MALPTATEKSLSEYDWCTDQSPTEVSLHPFRFSPLTVNIAFFESMAEDTLTLNRNFGLDNIFFKVENELFCVPRCEFVQSSEVFADMFLLPLDLGGTTKDRIENIPLYLKDIRRTTFRAC